MIDILTLATTDAGAFMQRVCETAGCSITNEDEISEIKDITIDDVQFTLKLVNSVGGYEGEGEYVERVFSITHDGVVISYVRDIGSYDSYCGLEMNGEFNFVEPRQVMITKYFKKTS